MIVANFFHIKSTNGLYFYGLDYLRQNLDIIRLILVRPELEHHFRNAFPGVRLVACSVSRYLFEVINAQLNADLIYTPTPHPLPFINRQWIVIHDAYPFEVGPKSKLKYFLLKWSLVFSRCWVGYINRSDSLPFIFSLGVATNRMIFAPNCFPEAVFRVPSYRFSSRVTTVGLLGTDSAKKNYDRLFNAVRVAAHSSRLMFRIYGHNTAYFRDIQDKFLDIQIELVKSDETSIDDFICSVDVLASASEQEGFGRPIASALLAGLRVELLDRPVFREFFTGGAHFQSDLDALVRSLTRHSGRNMLNTSYVPPPDVIAAFVNANTQIRRLGSNTFK